MAAADGLARRLRRRGQEHAHAALPANPGGSGAPGRPDVLAFVSDVLTSPLKISGGPLVNLVASTSGTDSDWVVKLIDVYPDEVVRPAALGGYQLMVSGDIFRGRYRE